MADDPFKFVVDDSGKDAATAAPPDAEAPLATLPAGGRGLGALRDLLGGNWLLAVLFAAGVACLYGMSLMKGPSGASAQQTDVESSVDDALAKLSGLGNGSGGGKTTAAIVQTFYYEARNRQIPAAALRCNPFHSKVAASALPAAQSATEPKTAGRPPEATEASEMMAAAKALSLKSVLLGGRQTAAIICDNLLTEGQVIHGWTVAKILPREVVLTWKDQNYVLRMPE